ncbi:Uncharacterised protein [Yersinia rohdei]|uniref:Uncharacterized protein n=1 Tax=Yersinia rohdei TaxID=29485 RepID=A0A0U1HUP5_YERRO|nr:hypothetical protein [Yersinia rohdei]CQI92556.1 Uncharacterised protein [Yersinia rohdei]
MSILAKLKKKIRSDPYLQYFLKNVSRRGHSYQEMMAMPLALFNLLFVYESYVEPNGARIDQIRHAQVLETLYKSSGNLSKEGLRSISINDFDMCGLISGKSQEELLKQKQKADHDNMMRLFVNEDKKDNGKQ